MEDQNWLKDQGYSDADFASTLGLSNEVVQREGFNRAMLDLVHSENMAGYIDEGLDEKKARHMADKKRSEAMKAAKENGLKM